VLASEKTLPHGRIFFCSSTVGVVTTTPTNSLQYFFILEIPTIRRYNTSVMIISFEASASVDTTLFGYFSMEYDPEFFSDIKENLTDIPKNQPLTFKLDTDNVKLLQGAFHNIRRIICIPDVEKNKFTYVFKRNFESGTTKQFKYAKLHIDKDYFYFTGHHENLDGTKPVEFQSLNFDARFIDTIQNQYIKHQGNMVN
jgi:hypothetical protein